MGKFIFKVRKDKDFMFNLIADNGQVILTSEGYNQRIGCDNGIESVRKNSQEDERFERKISTNSKFYFNLKSSNGEIIGTSEMYESEAARENGIKSVRENAPHADIKDETC